MHRTTNTTRSTIIGLAPVLRCAALCMGVTAKSRTGPAGLLLINSITDP